MTREEAIKRLEDTFEGWNMWAMDNDSPASKMSKALDMAISALREQPRWIPVTERLPELDKPVLCLLRRSGEQRIGSYIGAEYRKGVATFVDPSNRHYAFGVTHWMPLPEPPEVEV